MSNALRKGRYWEAEETGREVLEKGGEEGAVGKSSGAEWWVGGEEGDCRRIAGAGAVVSEMVGGYHTLSGQRIETCNPALLSSWHGGVDGPHPTSVSAAGGLLIV